MTATVNASASAKKDALEKTGRRFDKGVGGFVQWMDGIAAKILRTVQMPYAEFTMTDGTIERIAECVTHDAEIAKPFLTEYAAQGADGTKYVLETDAWYEEEKIRTASSLYRKNPYEQAAVYDPNLRRWEKDRFLDRILDAEGHERELVDAVRYGGGYGLVRFGTKYLAGLIDAAADLFRFDDSIDGLGRAGLVEIFEGDKSSLMLVLVPKTKLITGSWATLNEDGGISLCNIDPCINRLERNGYFPLHGEGYIVPEIESKDGDRFMDFIHKLWTPPADGKKHERLPHNDYTVIDREDGR